MRVFHRSSGQAAAWALAAFLAAGCGGSDHDGVTFHGNVSDVQRAAAEISSPREGWLAGWISRSFQDLWVPSAVAQAPCASDVELLVVCAVGFGPTPDDPPRSDCERVDPTTCRFRVSVELPPGGAVAGVVFFEDLDGDRNFDGGEREADLAFECESGSEGSHCVVPMCNGDLISARNVTVEFYEEETEGKTGQASAEEVTKTRSGCGPNPTPAVTPTPTPEPPLLPVP